MCFWIVHWLSSLFDDQWICFRKLGGKSLDAVTRKATSRNSSMSTITMSSSSRKPLKGSADDNQNSVVESNAAAERSSSGSVVSKCQKLRPKSSFGGPRNTKIGTSNVAGKTSSSRNTRYSTREITKSENLLQNRNSSAGKSSVGSSYTHGNILKNVNTTTMPKNGRSKKVLGTAVQVQEMQIKARTQCLQHQNRASGAKFVSQETKSKVRKYYMPFCHSFLLVCGHTSLYPFAGFKSNLNQENFKSG